MGETQETPLTVRARAVWVKNLLLMVTLTDDGQNSIGDQKSADWRSNVSATAKLLLCTVRDSADAFPPLKSVVGCLCSILENYEVRFTP